MAKEKDDVLQFLDSLDGPDAAPSSAITTASGTGAVDQPIGAALTSGNDATGQDVLDFLDEITQTASSTPAPSASGTNSAANANNATGTAGSNAFFDQGAALPSRYLQQQKQQQQKPQEIDSRSSWLGSLWSTASEAVKTTQTAVQSSVKASMESGAGKILEERVKGIVNAENIGKIGNDLKSLTLSSMTTVLDVIAPPIAEHEVVEIWLAHDMVGYVGVESLVYRSFSEVMEQTDGGDVVVYPGAGQQQNQDEVLPEDRQLNICDGHEQAIKLARANVDHLLKSHYDETQHQQGATNPNTHKTRCPVFMAIQPFRAPRAGLGGSTEDVAKLSDKDLFVSYALVLQDPTHKLEFETFSQSLPAHWLLIPYEENEWVENRMVDCLRLAVGVIGQDYVWTRMKGEEVQRLQQQSEAAKEHTASTEASASAAPGPASRLAEGNAAGTTKGEAVQA